MQGYVKEICKDYFPSTVSKRVLSFNGLVQYAISFINFNSDQILYFVYEIR